MNRRNVFQLGAAAVLTPAAVLAAPVAPPLYGDAVLCQLLQELNEAWVRHTYPTAFGAASPSSITIPPRPFRAYPPTKVFP